MVLFTTLLLLFTVNHNDTDPVNGITPGEDAYPHPVEYYEFSSQNQDLRMAYMDISPMEPNGETIVLLHGKNFCGPYWHQTIEVLAGRGFRVLVPEQIGFCRSSLPEHYQFGLHQIAHNTRELLDHAGVSSAIVMGHSMGGMLAMRFALMYPDFTQQLLLLNPIGLEDWLAEGVPYIPISQIYQAELAKTFDGIREYQQQNYYDGEWNEEYERWARMLADSYEGEQAERVAWNHALTAEMIVTQPVIHEAERIRVPTVLMIGERDRTAIGKDRVDEETAARLGYYPRLAQSIAKRIPDAELISFTDLGHMPHIEDEERYIEALFQALQ